jgi:solute carrier family 25 carnitine/acylcarnitine transporter 20/29
MYEHMKHIFSQLMRGESPNFNTPPSEPSPLAVLLAGGLSGASAWAATCPLDVIKNNIQGKPLAQATPSILSIVRKLWQAHGIKAFYYGVGPSIARACIVSSSRFSAYEFAMRMLNQFEDWNRT